jgi:hypothetical protein
MLWLGQGVCVCVLLGKHCGRKDTSLASRSSCTFGETTLVEEIETFSSEGSNRKKSACTSVVPGCAGGVPTFKRPFGLKTSRGKQRFATIFVYLNLPLSVD